MSRNIIQAVRSVAAIIERSNEALVQSGGRNPKTLWLGNVLHINDITWFHVAITEDAGISRHDHVVHTTVGWIASVRDKWDEGGEFDWADTVQEAFEQSNGGHAE